MNATGRGVEAVTACESAYRTACTQLYRCELALHDASQTGVDRWIKAAADRLHESLVVEQSAAAALAAARAA
jgi:hypothetical protein